MAASDDLKAHATSDTDFCALLGLQADFLQQDFSKKTLDRAWRRTALKYHPDKAGASDHAARERFHLASIAYDLLGDSGLRELYKNAREARHQRQKQDELMDGKRRQMKQDLERRERAAAEAVTGAKRARDATSDAEEQLQKEIDRIAADGKRMRLEREEKLRRQLEQEQEEVVGVTQAQQEQYVEGRRQLEKSVKVKFLRSGESPSDATLQEMFSTFGTIEIFSRLGDRRERVEGSKHKKTINRALVLYKSLIGTYSAIEDWRKQKRSEGGAWLSVVDVSWAEGKEPNCLNAESVLPAPNDATPRFSTFHSTAIRNAEKAPARTKESALDDLRKQKEQHDEERRQLAEEVDQELDEPAMGA